MLSSDPSTVRLVMTPELHPAWSVGHAMTIEDVVHDANVSTD